MDRLDEIWQRISAALVARTVGIELALDCLDREQKRQIAEVVMDAALEHIIATPTAADYGAIDAAVRSHIADDRLRARIVDNVVRVLHPHRNR